ncbi:STE20-related kinase adapter protein beta [Nannospalax galili]|uniref:STE20-related kinase adapter protein beta n=1 Tax=Nannospalax galili TaxID=1026970 RepID=A0A8C6RA92_NANGA|nr:STE20-related kinase adapter protein beta [Nannospalax galili]XP_017655055.1 STE20-related kinase adapter protein beta [Nannospalax galili]XP_029422125.1 STE20-related kinase adapter protein beta [Nannospalax galili]XP_029422126.1 STE20-related kinase adapter protein beta [Nannospalax galili]XP_029422127.1 STE20-related kinase adapter protein beta [Nannospalax galili]
MSLLDCFCTSRTRVESLRPEKQSESSIHQYLVDEPPLSWSPPSARANEVIGSTTVSHYELQVEIGRGFDNLTSVYLARHTPTGTLVTIKITNLENCTDERLKALQKEVILSHFFQHPNITTYWTVFTVGSWLWVISPFMAYGSASQLLKTYFPEGMSETLIRNILFGAVQGLNYLHQNGCIHRSFKASHILISGDGLVTLSGLSHLHSLVKHGQRHRAVFDFPQFSTSVQPWLSPELLRQDLYGYNVKSDIYSIGITACELASGQVPFQDMHRTQMLLQKLKGPPYSPLDLSTLPQSDSRMRNSQSGVDSGIGESVLVSSGTHTVNSDRLRTPSSKTFSPAFFSLVQLCLQQDPEKRPSASSLLSHAFFKQMKEESQDSILSLLPPAYNKPAVALAPVAPWTELECDFPDAIDPDWAF